MRGTSHPPLLWTTLYYTLPVAGKAYLFRVPYYGFYIQFLKKVGLFIFGYR